MEKKRSAGIIILGVILILFLLINPTFAQDSSTSVNSRLQEDIVDEMFMIDRYVIILKSTKDYDEAVSFATEASKKIDLEFDSEHIEYSKERVSTSHGILMRRIIDYRTIQGAMGSTLLLKTPLAMKVSNQDISL